MIPNLHTRSHNLSLAQFAILDSDISVVDSTDDAVHTFHAEESTAGGGVNEYHLVADPASSVSACPLFPGSPHFVRLASHIDPESDIMFSDGLHGYKRLLPGDGAGPPTGGNVRRIGEVFWHMQIGILGVPESALAPSGYFLPKDGGTSDFMWRQFVYLDEQRSLKDLLGQGLFENRAVETIVNGQIALARFQPYASAGTGVFTITPKNATKFRLTSRRFAKFFNVFTFIARGHPVDRNYRPPSAVKKKNQESIDFFGEKQKEIYFGEFLDGMSDINRESDALQTAAQEIVTLHGSHQRMASMVVNAATEDAEAAMAIEPGQHVNLTWAPEDPDYAPVSTVSPWIDLDTPETVFVTGVEKDLENWTIKPTILRIYGGFAKYTDGAPVFPTSLSGETGYGGGSAAVWNASWSDTLKRYAKEHFAYYGENTTDILASDPGHSSRYS